MWKESVQIYSREMLARGVGYPLYMPSPSKSLPLAYQKKGISVGDVGIITPNGGFDFLFNACQPREEPDGEIHPVPDGFELLKSHIISDEIYYPRTHLLSTHVQPSDGSDSPRALVFQCSASGAVLALP
ncbi:hypothetical protein F5887DRAFT_614478, partial [Amanita rubescens]